MNREGFRTHSAAPVDLSKARKGDMVEFRIGGTATIAHIGPTNIIDEHGKTYREIELENVVTIACTNSGEATALSKCHPFDIIAVKPAFNWSMAKPGMAFRTKISDHLCWYIGPAVHRRKGDVVLEFEHQTTYQAFTAVSFLVRAPEHDIPTT